MVSSPRRAISCLAFLLSIVVVALRRTVPSKDATAIVTGKVTIKGKGVPGIVVGMRANEPAYSPRPATYRAVTDANGDYRITNLPAGNYSILPSAPAYVITDEFGSKTLMI